MFKKKKYKNPNKFLIKKNKFLRNFKDLYTEINDPWSQKENFNIDETTLILDGFFNAINQKFKKSKILDIGAASGYLKKKFNSKKFQYLGTDIHRKKFNNVIYDDITVFNKKFVKKYDLIFCLKTIYYVGDKINLVIKNIKKYLKKDGYLFINYNLKKNSFSNKYLTDLKLKKILKKNFKEILTIEINRELKEQNPNFEKTTIFIFKKINGF